MPWNDDGDDDVKLLLKCAFGPDDATSFISANGTGWGIGCSSAKWGYSPSTFEK